MTVKELIHILSSYDPELLVCYVLYSEQCLLRPEDITTAKLAVPRPDGWVADPREGLETIEYLVLPGN